MRDALLVLHMLGAGTWIGTNVMQAVVPALIERSGDRAVAAWYRVVASLNLVYIPAVVLILLTGSLMVVLDDAFSFADPFVSIGFAMVVLGLVAGLAVFSPTGRAVAEAAEAGNTATVKSLQGRLTRFGVLDTVLLVFTVFAMVTRLGA